jgi:transcriptional regulator with XRE-family HTH domain
MGTTLNLRLFRKANNLTQDAVAEYLGVTKGFISQVENGKVALPEDKMRKLLDNPAWSVEEYKKMAVTLMAAKIEAVEKSVAGEDGDAPQRVRLIPYEARGGMIGDFVDGVREYDCEMVVSPIKGVDFAMTVTGDSMMPEYYPGDRILIKKIDPNIFVEWGKVHVLDTPNGAVIKKLQKAESPEYVECVSLNPEYQSFTIPVNQIRGWYRVLMVMSMK